MAVFELLDFLLVSSVHHGALVIVGARLIGRLVRGSIAVSGLHQPETVGGTDG